MPDEPTIGELARVISGLQRSIESLSSKVLTVEVWKAEKESMEFRLRENEKDIATLEAKHTAEREKREREKVAADELATSNRRQWLLAMWSAFLAPVFVGIVLAWMLKG